MHSAKDFQRAADDVDYTFNWFYVDDKDIAYFNSGDNPVRAKGADPSLPVRAPALRVEGLQPRHANIGAPFTAVRPAPAGRSTRTT